MLYSLTYCLDEIGNYETFAEAFSVLYKKLKEDSQGGFALQLLETAIWIKYGNGGPIFFYEIVDRAKRYGLLTKDGKLNEEAIQKEINGA